MEYYSNRLCITMRELVDGGVMTEPNYKQLSARGRMEVVRRGGGAKGCVALIAVDSLPTRYQQAVHAAYPNGAQERLRGWVMSHYEVDASATRYFFDKTQCGVELPAQTAREYITNASVLNCCIKLYNRAATAQRLFGGKYDWEQMSQAIEALRVEYGHTLPTSTLRFRKKVHQYERDGYSSLISGKWGNQSARKVHTQTERLIVSIACLPNRPYGSNVLDLYNSFVTGALDVYDPETGALYDPETFVDKHGEPLVLSETTILNYLNKPKNRLLIEKATSSYTTFMHEQMPHMHRHAGRYSLSKVSFDDRDLPRKLKDTKQRVKAYYAYDVVSGACIGASYNRRKNVDLVVDMFRDMFRLLDREGWGCPAEVEVENHLMSQWKDSFLRAGVMFPFVRFCAPMNSQEKYAEACNGAKKRAVEHRNHVGIGRFYAKQRAYRTESKKVFDEFNDTYEDKTYYDWDELVADDRRDIAQYNASLHPDQERYPGMSRWDVLVSNVNPGLQPLDKATIARYVGEKVRTSVRRNSTCRVLGKDWWLSRPEALELLRPGDYTVDAYYLTKEDGSVTDLFIYQGDLLIDRLEDVGTYCSCTSEQTEADRDVFVSQRKKLAKFNKYVEEHATPLVRVQSCLPSGPPDDEAEEVVAVSAPVPSPPPGMDYSARALADV